MGSLLSFEELKCWKEDTLLRKDISSLLQTFPSNEKYLLIDQIKRASRSVTNNIAEGFGRFYYLENVQFCRMSRGSLHELIDHFIIAYDEGYINQTVLSQYKTSINKVLSLLNGYINYLNKAKKQ